MNMSDYLTTTLKGEGTIAWHSTPDERACCAPPKQYKVDVKVDDESCTKIHTMEIPGMNINNVDVVEKWVNRIKEMRLIVTIKDGTKFKHQDTIYVDTYVYDRYHVEVKDGLLTITLYEIINEKPKFERV